MDVTQYKNVHCLNCNLKVAFGRNFRSGRMKIYQDCQTYVYPLRVFLFLKLYHNLAGKVQLCDSLNGTDLFERFGCSEED
jgi:hypothetical protein